MDVPVHALAICIVGCVSVITHGAQLHTMSSRPFVTRRLSNVRERVDIVCPDTEVMLGPKLAYGVSTDRRSSRARPDKDCLGTDSQLVKQSDRCVGNNMCNIALRKGVRLTRVISGLQQQCFERFANYIAISLPKCVPSDGIHDICSVENNNAVYSKGILRRNDRFSRDRTIPKGKCQRVMHFNTSVTLAMKLDTDAEGSGHVTDAEGSGHVTVKWTNQHGKARKKTLRSNHDVYSGTGNDFKVTWRIRKGHVQNSSFYLIYHVQTGADMANGRRLIPELRTASLQSAMTWRDRQMAFVCPRGSLMYSPQLMAGVGRRLECEGITPSLLVQKNDCYWQRTCDIHWRDPAIVTLSNSATCLGRTAAVMATTGYSCIRQDKIVSICSRNTPRVLRQSYGVIRSHNIYPWDYGAEAVDCRKVIKIEKGRQLLLTLELSDVDEDRDTFRIRHIHNKTKTDVIIGNVKNFNASISGGSVEIALTVSRWTKSGKGFLLHYEKTGKATDEVIKPSRTKKHIRRPRKSRKKRRKRKNSRKMKSRRRKSRTRDT